MTEGALARREPGCAADRWGLGLQGRAADDFAAGEEGATLGIGEVGSEGGDEFSEEFVEIGEHD